MNDIQNLNVVWIFASFTLLYYGLSGDGRDLYNAFQFIIYLFLILWYIGQKAKDKEFQESINKVGDPVRGQWDYMHIK